MPQPPPSRSELPGPSLPGRRRFALAAMAAAVVPAFPRPAAATAAVAPLRQPREGRVLTISGRISNYNQRDLAIFDRPMLEELGPATIVTNTPWYDGPVRFDGAPMAKLMQAVGAEGEFVTAVALNDYSTDIPISDFARFGVILAMLRNGAPMRVSDKGPLFVIYPFDSNPDLRTRQYYSRCAWSVSQLIIK